MEHLAFQLSTNAILYYTSFEMDSDLPECLSFLQASQMAGFSHVQVYSQTFLDFDRIYFIFEVPHNLSEHIEDHLIFLLRYGAVKRKRNFLL